MKNIGTRLKELRGTETQANLAKRLGISQQGWARYETGKILPGAEVIRQICSTFGVSADWLLGLSDVREPVGTSSSPATRAPRAAPSPVLSRVASSPLSCGAGASPSLLSPAGPTLSDVMAELKSLSRRVNALESSSLATCG